MTKKDFIALADYIREANRCMPNLFTKEHLDYIAAFCLSRNPAFLRSRWLDYIAGNCGPNGGKP